MNVYYVADVRRVLGKSPVAPAGVGRGRSSLARSIDVVRRVIEASNEQRVGLTVDDDNTPAIALYRSLGFVRTA